jgi:septin family protein
MISVRDNFLEVLMNNLSSKKKFSKQVPALAAAAGMTLLIGLATLGVSANALLNRDVVPLQSSVTGNQSSGSDNATIQQLQDLIAQYQSREQQYQAREQQLNQELQQAAQQLNGAEGQIQQYQSLFIALQNAGVIRVDRNGQIFIPQSGFGGEDNEGGEGQPHG